MTDSSSSGEATDGLLPCSRCKARKIPDAFYRNRATKTGRDVYCIACRKVVHKGWLATAKPESKAKIRASRRRYTASHSEAVAERFKRWLASLSEEHRLARRAYTVESNRRYRDRKKAAEKGEVSP